MNGLTQEQRIVHLLNRISFGPKRADVERVNRLGIRAYFDEQLQPHSLADDLVEEKLAHYKFSPPRLQRLIPESISVVRHSTRLR